MDPQNAGLVAGLVGGGIGVVGGVVGTFYGLANATGPRERAFVLRMAVVMWAAMIAFLLGLWLVPRPFNVLLWLPYGVLLPLAIRRMNRRQEALRRAEVEAPAGS